MVKLLKDLTTAFLNFLDNANYLNFFNIITVAVTAYYIAKYNTSKPNKLKVKQLQLSNVYLPLYRITENLPPEPSKQQALEFHRKVSNILDKNYELVFPQLHKLNHSLRQDILCDGAYQKTVHIMKHQIDTDYELLKKKLGYPSENLYSIFIHMTFKQKAYSIFTWISTIWVFSFLPITIYLSVHLNNGNNFRIILLAFVLILLPLILLARIGDWIDSLKD